jgi:carboxymethylenebutenolidase
LVGEEIDADIDALTSWLVNQGFETSRRGIIGFCLGGSEAFHTATRGLVGAAVAFYGGGISADRFGQPGLLYQASGLVAPFLGLYGDQDPYISVEDIEALRAATLTPAKIRGGGVFNGSIPTSPSKYDQTSAMNSG